jgi:oxygen-independent coproporphyrinogen III oxidase
MGKIAVDLALIQKYNVPGPRYTSYPTAPHFSEAIAWEQVEPKVRENNEADRDLSLYFHLPFCQNLCWFCGCNTVITHQQDKSAIYVEYLKKEMAMLAPRLNPRRRVGQLHFGGGTPTFLLPDELRAIGGLIHQHFQFSNTAEAGVEIDPRGVTRDHIKALREIGFNRASMGVQDNNPVVQKAVHRIQPFELTARTVDWLREAGFISLNIDLIYGLPYQTVDSFERTLDEILTLKPDRFAIFNYAHVPWLKRSQRAFKTLPTPEVKLGLLKLSIEKLAANGYVYIGMDHFARENDELAVAQRNKSLQRNFQGYSTHGGADIYAFGISSISQTDSVYWQNQKDLPKYYEALDTGVSPLAKGYLLSADDRIRRQTIMRLMCDLELDYPAMTRLLNVDFPAYFAPELASLNDLVADDLLVFTPAGLKITETGRLLIRNIAMRFDAYLRASQDRQFSKTI